MRWLCHEKVTKATKRFPLLPLPVEGALGRVAVDILGPFKPSYRQNRYIVVCSDYLTRWCEAFPVPSVEVNAIKLLQGMVDNGGVQNFSNSESDAI